MSCATTLPDDTFYICCTVPHPLHICGCANHVLNRTFIYLCVSLNISANVTVVLLCLIEHLFTYLFSSSMHGNVV